MSKETPLFTMSVSNLHGSAGRQPLAVGKQLASAASRAGDTHVPVEGSDAAAESWPVLSVAAGVGPPLGEPSSDSSTRRRTADSSATGVSSDTDCSRECGIEETGELKDADEAEGAEGVAVELLGGDW